MNIQRVEIKNFRMLLNVDITIEEKTTVIVGRNNSGKTSITELFRRLLSENSPKFAIEDFSLSSHELFWAAFEAKNEGKGDAEIRTVLPAIEVSLYFNYDKDNPDLGTLGDFIIDLNAASTLAIAVIRYHLKEGGIKPFFENLKCVSEKDSVKRKRYFFREVKDRIPSLFTTSLIAVDPNDRTNQKPLELSHLRALLQPGFINAHRGLDDVTQTEKDVLGKILGRLLIAASSEEADASDRATVDALETAVHGIQEKLDADFSTELDKLLPALSFFGYPGLGDPQLQTETTLDVQRLLGNNTKIRYPSSTGISLPETYNGLGSRNLIFILLQILEFFKSYKARSTSAGIHLIFIEEPEAHLHPQMQEVFIRKVKEIAETFAKEYNGGEQWPVQFIITTHSTHIANESSFESIRYFLSSKKGNISQTQIKDLRNGLKGTGWNEDKDFLHKYLTLTRCDLFFADKAILIEGPTERLLMPKIIEKIDVTLPKEKILSSQYVSVIEVGGAYAYKFFKLLDFLELRTLVITDMDSVSSSGGAKCLVAEGTHTSNATIKKWFNDANISPATLIAKTNAERIDSIKCLAYQIPENGVAMCGRSFEDAFMLANQVLFSISGGTEPEKAREAWDKAQKESKTDFALKYAIDQTTWNVPRYITEGLTWLAENSKIPTTPTIPVAKPIVKEAPANLKSKAPKAAKQKP